MSSRFVVRLGRVAIATGVLFGASCNQEELTQLRGQVTQLQAEVQGCQTAKAAVEAQVKDVQSKLAACGTEKETLAKQLADATVAQPPAGGK